MRRVLFEDGGQRKFLDLVIAKLDSPSLRGILQFGFDVPYSTLKNYYVDVRLMPEGLFLDMCDVAKLDVEDFGAEYVSGSWGQVKGGEIGKRKS